MYKFQLETKLLQRANQSDNYVSLHLQSAFVVGVVGAEDVAHKMKHLGAGNERWIVQEENINQKLNVIIASQLCE